MSEPLTKEALAMMLLRWRGRQGLSSYITVYVDDLGELEATIEARDAEIAELRKTIEFLDKVSFWQSDLNKVHATKREESEAEVVEARKQIAKLQACLWELVYNADNTDWDYEWCQGEHNELIARARKLSKGKELAESGEEVRDDEA